MRLKLFGIAYYKSTNFLWRISLLAGASFRTFVLKSKFVVVVVVVFLQNLKEYI